jgi:post-segregation antitoxin (ccd killing protein)
MAKTSIYLPDDLAEQVRAYGISISEAAQAALRQAVKTAQLRENSMTDIQAVAERLRETRRQDAAHERELDDKARAFGVEWASQSATAAELEYVTTYDGPDEDYSTPMSLIKHGVGPGVMVWSEARPARPGDTRWAQFRAGAREVWEGVKPLLMEIDENGGSLPAGSGSYSETVSPERRLPREPDPGTTEHDRWMTAEPDELL